MVSAVVIGSAFLSQCHQNNDPEEKEDIPPPKPLSLFNKVAPASALEAKKVKDDFYGDFLKKLKDLSNQQQNTQKQSIVK